MRILELCWTAAAERERGKRVGTGIYRAMLRPVLSIVQPLKSAVVWVVNNSRPDDDLSAAGFTFRNVWSRSAEVVWGRCPLNSFWLVKRCYPPSGRGLSGRKFARLEESAERHVCLFTRPRSRSFQGCVRRLPAILTPRSENSIEET